MKLKKTWITTQLTLMLLVLLTLAAAAPKLLASQEQEGGIWSPCSRSCGTGVSVKMRGRCRRPGDKGCPRHAHYYRTCNTEPCSKSSEDFRTQQCREKSTKPWRGSMYDWKPFRNPTEPCALWCEDERTNTVARLEDSVTDGTRCDNVVSDVCIKGKCRPVGCDGVLGSSLQLDVCGVCGGNGSTCKDSPEKARFYWDLMKASACSVTCGTGTQPAVSVCRDKRSQYVVPSSYCKGLKQPPDQTLKCAFKPCNVSWYKGSWESCSVECDLGTSLRVVYCASILPDGSVEKTDEKYCSDLPKPNSEKRCHMGPCPDWHTGKWSKCTAECGGGTKKRQLECKLKQKGENTPSDNCNKKTKPDTHRKCNTHPCDDKHRGLAADGLNKAIPSFVAGDWSACSATCGEGRRIRKVACRVFLPFSKTTMGLPKDECKGVKPAEAESCNLRSCSKHDDMARDTYLVTAGVYNWRLVGYSSCSATCLGGEEHSISKCFHVETGKHVSSEKCRDLARPERKTRPCNQIPCPPQWQIGEYGSCSSSCGGGKRVRSVVCVQQIAAEDTTATPVPAAFCPLPKPDDHMTCADADCPPFWTPGDWSDCSSTCLDGVQRRKLHCTQVQASGIQVTHSNVTPCFGITEPETERRCGKGPCGNVVIPVRKPRIVVEHADTVQMRQMSKLNVVVGGTATLLPGTPVVIRCPARKFNQKLVKWYKDGRLITSTRGRVRLTRKGGLKMRSSKPHDAATYVCRAGESEASITIKFQSLEQGQLQYEKRHHLLKKLILKERRRRKKNRLLPPLSAYAPDGSELQADEAITAEDGKHRKGKDASMFKYVPGEWSKCSVTCGGGTRSRDVHCEGLAENYYKIVPDRKCEKEGEVKPHAVEFCMERQCTAWKSSNWSQCSYNHCLRPSTSLKHRTSYCTSSNGTRYSDHHCNNTTRPGDETECDHEMCLPLWKTGKWSECSTTCGRDGVRTRTAKCVWTTDGRSAGHYCADEHKPTTEELCTPPPCAIEIKRRTGSDCQDESKFCNLILMLDMCQYDNYRKQCCDSCSKKIITTPADHKQ